VKKEATVDEITQFVPSKSPAILVDLGDGNYSIITKYDIVHTISQIAEEKV
jgi:predicted transcriptional regulator